MAEAGEWVLDLSRLVSLTSLNLNTGGGWCEAVTDKEVLALSHLTRLTDLNLWRCRNVSAEAARQ